MTGWFNIAGLLGIVASVAYGAAIFLNSCSGLYGLNILGVDFGDTSHVLGETFLLFLIILAFVTAAEHLADKVPGGAQQHLRRLAPPGCRGGHRHSSSSCRTTTRARASSSPRRFNESGFFGGSTSNFGFWFFVLPIGFLLTMYTETGYDASAHTAEETQGAAIAAAQGVWRSVFYSAIIGWILLLSFLFAATNVSAIDDGAGYSTFDLHLGARFVGGEAGDPDRDRGGQLFCGAAGSTSASRTWYAFSRDRAIPGWNLFRRVNRDRVPFNAVIAVSFFSLVISIPALFGKNDVPFAFYALTGICTVGLYVAYIIPVYLRLRAGDSFKPGPWTLGARYKWVNTIGILFVILVVFALDLPYTPAGLPWKDGFDASLVNYTPLAILLPLGLRDLVPGLG